MPQGRGALVAVAAAAALLLAGSGCSGADQPAAEPSPASSSPPAATEPATEPATGPAADPTSQRPSAGQPGDSGSAQPTAQPTAEPTAQPAQPSAATGRAPSGLAAALLPASDLPGFNAAFTWREQGTSTREPADLATCNRFAVTSLGAIRTITRTYVPAAAPGPPARHLVAAFPDRATAARAYDVLGAWRRQCQDRLARYDLRRVGPLTPVTVPSGSGAWYLLTYGPVRQGSDDAVFSSTGLATSGARVAVLDLRLVGQDFNYSLGREPMVTAVQRAAALLR